MLTKRKFKNWLDFVLALTNKEIKTRYKRATFGFTWIILQPLTQMLVMGIIFQFFIPIKMDNYFAFLFAGLLPWNFFSQSVNKATPIFFAERNLIKKAKFPREAIVLSVILANLVYFLVALILFIIILFIKQTITNFNLPNLWVIMNKFILLIFTILLLFLFTVGLSLSTASLNLKFRDMSPVVQLVTLLWFYATPIVYSLNLLPTSFQPFFYFNPMSTIIELFQFAILNVPITIPTLIPLTLIIIVLITYFGIFTFRRESPTFDDWL